jgi:hypothetical protein
VDKRWHGGARRVRCDANLAPRAYLIDRGSGA